MTPCHRTLFWANLAAPVQFVPSCLSSASVSHLQLLRGQPLFLFPCGFQVRAWRVMLDAGFLRVCPIQPHFLFRICFAIATVSCPTRSHRSSLGSSLAVGCCRCTADRCWRMSGFSVALPLFSSKFHIRRARLTSHWSWRCEVWFLSWSPWMTKCSWAWQKLLCCHMVHPLSWCDGLSTSMTQRATPAGAYAPGRATHAGQGRGQTNVDHLTQRLNGFV